MLIVLVKPPFYMNDASFLSLLFLWRNFNSTKNAVCSLSLLLFLIQYSHFNEFKPFKRLCFSDSLTCWFSNIAYNMHSYTQQLCASHLLLPHNTYWSFLCLLSDIVFLVYFFNMILGACWTNAIWLFLTFFVYIIFSFWSFLAFLVLKARIIMLGCL